MRGRFAPVLQFFKHPLCCAQIKARRPCADGVDPQHFARGQQLPDQVLAARGVATPIIRENEKWRSFAHN